ncbi:MAG: SAM-dependent chlorinase/fluorinase, partial [Nitrospiraceae bacterium]|nr:SAM-dependent chlorinase/fluorinase [Nitrospiraceae bacterium]
MLITLTTDFGNKDGFPAQMKGVILGMNPEARIVDITHQIAPWNIAGGSYILKTCCRYFPHGTIHVAVVDPGV